jgi:hypothetical protein
MKRTRKLAVILTVLMILSVFPMGVFAEEESKKMPTASFDEKVTLNDAGEVMPIRRAVLNLEDEDGPYTVTRVRLRDVAFALSSTEAKFDISFDEKQNAIIITTGVPYEQSEYDKREIDLKDANIIDSPHKVLVDGVEAKLDAYNIDGETYTSITKLRKALGNKFYVRTIHDTGETLISFEKNDMEEFTKEAFDAKVKEKKITLVYAGAPWCPWTKLNLKGLIPFQEYIEKNGADAQIIAMVHDYQDYYKSDVLRDYQESSSNPEKEMADYPFYTVGMTSEGWDHISKIAGTELKYLPSIFFMNDEGKLVKYIQGGEDEGEEQEETDENGEPVSYNYIEMYEEIVKDLDKAE